MGIQGSTEAGQSATGQPAPRGMLQRIGAFAVGCIAIVWTLMWVLLFGHMSAVCAALFLWTFLKAELPPTGYYVLLATCAVGLLSQIVLRRPWPARVDSMRRILRGLTIIPFALGAAAIVAGVLTYLYLLVAGQAG